MDTDQKLTFSRWWFVLILAQLIFDFFVIRSWL